MIPLWMTVAAFLTIALITKSYTYWILTISALVNVYINNYTTSEDLYLMVVYSSIEFFTCLAILKYGDVNKIYQSTMLFLMLTMHLIMEIALEFDNVWFIESNIYPYSIAGLIILQLLGARYGLNNTLHRNHNNMRQVHHFRLFNYKKVNIFTGEKK